MTIQSSARPWTFGRYEILERLGEGGQATVYRARDREREGREVALKVLRADAPRTSGSLSREFEALAALSHPNLIAVLDYGTTHDGLPYFSCEYFPAQDFVRALEKATLDEKLATLAQVLRGLEYIHTRGLIHFDVKPENLLVRRLPANAAGPNGAGDTFQVKISDFGLAAPADGTATPRGTPHYLAPEVARGAGAADRRADLYSLGVVAYELLCGARPFEGDNALAVIERHLKDRPLPPRERGATLPEALERIVLRLLEKEPAHRFSSANEVLGALAEAFPDIRAGGRSPFEFETEGTKEAYVLSGKFVGRDRELDWLVEAYRAAVAPVQAEPEDPREFDRRARFAVRRAVVPASSTALPTPAPAPATTAPSGDEPEAETTGSERRRGGDRRAKRLGDREAPPPPALLVLLGGESGVGKTRLLQELKRRAQVEGAQVVEGACRKHLSRSYEPFVDVVKGVLGRATREGNPSDAATAWAVKQLLEEGAPDSPAPPALGANQVERLRFIDAIAELLLAHAVETPLVVAIEHLQWARPETLELLQHLERSLVAARAAGGPVPRLLILATYRPEEVRGPELGRALRELRRDRFFEELNLRPLRTDDASELIVSMLGVPDVPRKFVERVMGETLGNPLFIEELMAELVARGLIDRRRGLWRFSREKALALEVPNRVGSVVLARLERFGPEARRLLDALAALDRPAKTALLARVLERDEAELEPILDRLVRARVVARRGSPETSGFVHAKTRDVVFGAIGNRVELHARLARALASSVSDGETPDQAEVAHHLLEARAGIEAVEAARLAAERAAALGAGERACELWQRALVAAEDLLLQLPAPAPGASPSDADPRRARVLREKLETLRGHVRELTRLDKVQDARARTLEGLKTAQALGDTQAEVAALAHLGTLNARLKEFEDAKKYFFESLKTAERIDWKRGIGTSLLGLGDLKANEGELEDALAYLERSLEFEKDLGDARAVARSLRGIANALRKKGDTLRAIEQCERALELDRRAQDSRSEGETLELLADVCFVAGDIQRALEATEQAFELARARDDKPAMTRGYLALGAAHDQRGEIGEARRNYEEAARLARRLGRREDLARALNNLGWTRHLEGDYDEAIARFNEATTLWNTLGDREGYALGLTNLGLAYGRTGELRRAASCYDCALRVSWESASRRREVEASFGRAEVSVRQGELGRARELLDKAAVQALELKEPRLEALVLGSLSVVLALQGERARSARAAQRAQALAREVRETARDSGVVARVELASARAALARSELQVALESLRNRSQWLRGSRERAVAVEAELAYARACLALGDDLAGRAAAETALAESRARGLKPIAAACRLTRADALLASALRAGHHRLGRALIGSDELRDARASAEAAQVEAEALGAIETTLPARLLLARAALAEGEAARARELLADLADEPLAKEDPLLSLEVAVGLVEAEATAGDGARALERADEALTPLPGGAPPLPRARLEAARALAASRLGRPVEARAAADEAQAALERAAAPLAPNDRRVFDESPLAQAILAAGREDAGATPASKALRVPGRDAGARATESTAHLPAARLLALIRAAHEANSADAIDTQLAVVLDGAIQAFDAERGLLIKVAEKGALKVRVARGTGGELALDDRSVSATVANQVAVTGEPLVLADAQSDVAFSERQSIAQLGTRSVLGVPLRAQGKTTHVLLLEHRSASGRFSAEDRDLCEAFADLASLALERTRLSLEAKRREQELAARADEIARLNAALSAKVEEQTHELEDVKEKLVGRERELELKYNYKNIIGQSEAMRRIFRMLDKVSDSDVPVLIYGESGTGKELVAKAIHWNGPRKKNEFLSINVAALPEPLLEAELFGYVKGAFTGADRDKKGLFESAHGGTLFLDEVGDMSPAMQTKLLRTLQEGEVRPVGAKAPLKVDVRIVSASNKDLRQLVEEGRFRADLFYRLNVIGLRLPPLRERREDIPLLVDHFLDKIATQTGERRRNVDRKVLEHLTRYDWPGNVRELENELRRVVALSGVRIGEKDLSTHIRGHEEKAGAQAAGPELPEGLTLKQQVELIERQILTDQLRRHEGNKTRTARTLGLSRYGFLKKLDKYRLRSGEEPEAAGDDAAPIDEADTDEV